MSIITGKRKRDEAEPISTRKGFLQIITGSYERVLHGLTCRLPAQTDEGVQGDAVFSDDFLFNAHTSSIRCLAISPPSDSDAATHQPSKRILATGGSDERINLYQLSTGTSSAASSSTKTLPTAMPPNRELGSLLHHSSTVTALAFPTRGKLLSASTDNTIAITRVRDWTMLSTIKVPIPKPAGRPSGDTAGPGEVPAGVNGIAVHPSLKLMLSVGQGERCMRLWNLVTGKKAGVLTFDREVLAAVNEGRWRGGEARSVTWDEAGQEFAVAFDRGIVIYGLDCKVRGVVKPMPGTKVYRVRYLPGFNPPGSQDNPVEDNDRNAANVVALSTEDGRLLFYDTSSRQSTNLAPADGLRNGASNMKKPPSQFKLLAQLGGRNNGIVNRIKDFEIVSPQPNTFSNTRHIPHDQRPHLLIVTASSDGAIRIWSLDTNEIHARASTNDSTNPQSETKPPQTVNGASTTESHNLTDSNGIPDLVHQVGTLLGTYETGRRITCLTAFLMADTNVDNGVPVPSDIHTSATLNREVEAEDDEWGGLSDDDDGQYDTHPKA